MNLLQRLFFALSFFAAAGAFAGGHDMGGGHPYEIEFQNIGDGLVRELQAARVQDADLGYPLAELAGSVKTTLVFVIDVPPSEMKLEDEARPGLNSVSMRTITFNFSIWQLLKDEQKRLFVLHEYLRFVHDLQGKPLDDSRANYHRFSRGSLALLANPGRPAVAVDSAEVLCRLAYEGTYALGLLKLDLYVARGSNERAVRAEVAAQCEQDHGVSDAWCASGVTCAPTRADVQEQVQTCVLAPLLSGAGDAGVAPSRFEAETKAIAACLKNGTKTTCASRLKNRPMSCWSKPSL